MTSNTSLPMFTNTFKKPFNIFLENKCSIPSQIYLKYTRSSIQEDEALFGTVGDRIPGSLSRVLNTPLDMGQPRQQMPTNTSVFFLNIQLNIVLRENNHFCLYNWKLLVSLIKQLHVLLLHQFVATCDLI